MGGSFHLRDLALVGEIERTFPVSSCECGDLEVWPLAEPLSVAKLRGRGAHAATACTP